MSSEDILKKLEENLPDSFEALHIAEEQDQLTAIDLLEFLALELPPRELLLTPWLPKAGLAMIHAYRGVGKTHLSLGIAYAVATGSSFLTWAAPQSGNVLFIDGEMPATVLQDRLAKIVKMNGNHELWGRLRIITPDLQKNIMPDLATPEGQEQINKWITPEIDLVIVDNLSCLVRTGRENDSQDWIPVQSWALNLRSRGISVLFIHHSGKTGAQRGTSKKEDVLDSVISLTHPKDYNPEEGAHFDVKYEKSRGFCGTDAKPFSARLLSDTKGSSYWETKDLEDSTYEKVIALDADGLTQTEIAQELGINKSGVSRHIKTAIAKGEIKRGTK